MNVDRIHKIFGQTCFERLFSEITEMIYTKSTFRTSTNRNVSSHISLNVADYNLFGSVRRQFDRANTRVRRGQVRVELYRI